MIVRQTLRILWTYSLLRAFGAFKIFQETIISESNGKYKLMKSLQLKKYRMKEKLILVEGHRTILDAISNGLEPKLIFTTVRSFDSPLGQQLFEVVRGREDVEIVHENLMRAVTDTVHSQGVCAAFPLPPEPDALPLDASLVIICDGISDPGNMGTIIRTSFGLGADAIVLTEGSCDPYSPKVLRSSMGTAISPALPILQRRWSDIPLLLGDKFQALVADANGKCYDEVDMCRSTAVVLGSEAIGVSNEAFHLNHAVTISIPMQRGLESLNVGVATSIILAEASRQRRRFQR